MNPSPPKQIMRTVRCVLVLYALSAGYVSATCSSTSYGTSASVTCDQTTDLLILSQSAGLWYHTGAAIGTGIYDWDSGIAGEQSIASGGTIEVTFSAGGGQLRIGNDVTPANALIGTVSIGNSIVAATQAFLDSLASTTPSTYTVDDGPGLTKVNQLNFYDDTSQGLELIVLTGSEADTVNILSIFHNNTFMTDGNGGGEHVNIGKAGSVQWILGPIKIVNNGDFTAITIDDHADATSRTAEITSTGVSGIAPALINWDEYGIGPVVLNTGTGSDRVNVLSIANPFGATSLTIQNTSGSDSVFIGDAGRVQAIKAPVSIAGSGAFVYIDDSGDPDPHNATYSSTGISGLAPEKISLASSAAHWTILANFGSGDDIVHVIGSPGNALSPDYSLIDLGGGNNECYINGSGLGENSHNEVYGGSGDDLFVISAAPANVATLIVAGDVQAIGDKLVYTSGTATGASPGNGTLVPTDPNAHSINYTSIELFSINDVIFISGFE